MMDSSTSAATIEKMKLSFACHGLPVLLVTDNGSNCTSQEFEAFLKSHGVRHVRTAPYHPASNGRAVQTFKTAMKKSGGKGESTRLSNFLFQYRITPHSSTGGGGGGGGVTCGIANGEKAMVSPLISCIQSWRGE